MQAAQRDRVRLFVASFAMLYFELLFIRWIPGQVRMLAYFTNFVLIACFFGVGAGMMMARHRRDLVPWAAAGVAGLVALTAIASPLWVMQRADSHVGNLADYTGDSGLKVAVHIVVAVFYVAVAACFAPFGQAIGRAFTSDEPLLDYLANLAGSLAGIAVFFVYSWFELGSAVWFALGLPLLAVITTDRRGQLGAIAATLAIVPLVAWLDAGKLWSPYQKLEIRPLGVDAESGIIVSADGNDPSVRLLPPEIGFDIAVNDDFYQHPADLRDEVIVDWPGLQKMRDLYDVMYQLRPAPERVLIVGGGSGNDAAAALRNGAKHVDVVEIDPRIVAIGRERHPERPYDDPRVTVHVDDARHFFHTAEERYDVVIFALIDSHRLMSTMSSLRLDSYLYTVESFRAASRLADDDGLQLVAFTMGSEWQVQRFGEMLRLAWGHDPVLLKDAMPGVDLPGVFFLQGPQAALGEFPRYTDPPAANAVMPTDDWPFVYARWRQLPIDYLAALFTVVVITGLVVRRLPGGGGLPNAHFFLLGAGFLLLESRNITSLAVVFGSTWTVNTVVFATILAMAMLSTLISWKVKIPIQAAYVALFLAIAGNAALPLETLAGADVITRLALVGGLSALPVFFSGIIFADSLKHTSDPSRALGSNLLGAVCGGVLEYLSLVIGLWALLGVIALLYALSAVAIRPRLLGTAGAIPAPV